VRDALMLLKWSLMALISRHLTFAMSTTDVDPTDKPNRFGDRRIPSGSPVRMPATTYDWPPNILFDAVYADCVLHRFSSKTLESTLKQWKSTFYPREITNAGQASYQKIIDH